MSKLYIIAGNKSQFDHWRKQEHRDSQELVYVHSREALRGTRKPAGRFIGTWYEREDIYAICLQLLVAESIDHNKMYRILDTRDQMFWEKIYQDSL